jgi:hypothetical protein
MRAAWVAAMLVCAASAAGAAPPAAISVARFGARADGKTDDRPAIQAAIEAAAKAGGEVYLPPGTYLVASNTDGYGSLDVPGGVHLRGAGQARTVLRQAPGAPPSQRLLRLSGDAITVEDLTLDGNKRAQSKDEQRHGIFATQTRKLVIRRVTARDFTGDGFYLFTGATDSTLTSVVATANDRNGLTLGGRVDGVAITDSKFVANRAQQVDSEPGGDAIVQRVTISRCELSGGAASGDFALTVSGTSPKARGADWTIANNRIDGGIFVVWAERVTIADNTGTNPTDKPSVTVYRTSSDVAIRRNRFELTGTRAKELAGVLVQGTGTGSAPDRVVIAENQIGLRAERGYGIKVEGALGVEITDNTLRGAGRPAPGSSGIYLRATNQAEDFRAAIVRGNTVRSFGASAISLHGNGQARLGSVEITDNTFDDDERAPAMTAGVSLDDGSGVARKITLRGNRSLRGVTRPTINHPANRAVISGDQP